MANLDPQQRVFRRRLSDQLLDKRLAKYTRLIQAGQIITAELNVDALFDVISTQTGNVLNVQRCSIFLLDDDRRHLCPIVAADLDAGCLTLSTDKNLGSSSVPPDRMCR